MWLSCTPCCIIVRYQKKQIEKLEQWYEIPGVLIIGYDMFTNFVKSAVEKIDDSAVPKGPKSTKSFKMTPEQKEIVKKVLINPGADFVICDEGQELKNEKTNKAIHIDIVKTQRRIILTGTRLQKT